MQNHWNPRVGRLGTMIAYTQSGIIGTGGLALSPTATTQYRIPTPGTRCAPAKLALSAGGIAASAGGTILATIFKRDNVNAANIALTAAFSMEADFITVANKVYLIPLLLSTLTDAQRTFQVGDQLYADIVAASAIETQPTQTAIVAEWFVLE